MFILSLAGRPPINNLVLRLLHLLTVQHRWRESPTKDFMGRGQLNNQWVGVCWVIQRKCLYSLPTFSFLPVLHALSVYLFFPTYWVFNFYSVIVLSAFSEKLRTARLSRKEHWPSNLTSLWNCTVYWIHCIYTLSSALRIPWKGRAYVMYCCTFIRNMFNISFVLIGKCTVAIVSWLYIQNTDVSSTHEPYSAWNWLCVAENENLSCVCRSAPGRVVSLNESSSVKWRNVSLFWNVTQLRPSIQYGRLEYYGVRIKSSMALELCSARNVF